MAAGLRVWWDMALKGGSAPAVRPAGVLAEAGAGRDRTAAMEPAGGRLNIRLGLPGSIHRCL
jgi:hypothetical protein